MKQRVFSHLKARAVLVIGVMGVSAWLAAQRPPPAPQRSRTGLATLLSAAIGAQADAAQLFWEPSRGVVLDWLWGRDLLFVARTASDALRDVFRAQVRVSPSGHPLAVVHWRNLTQSPWADDTGLQGRGKHAAFATLAGGWVQSATVLEATSPVFGLRRQDLTLPHATTSLTMALTDQQLQLSTGDTALLQFELATRTVRVIEQQPKATAPVGEPWRPSAGQQPAGPAGIFESTVKLGTLQVQLVAFDPGRLSWRLRAGQREPTVAGQRPAKYQLEPSEHERTLIALNLGHATVGTDYGMAFQGTSSLPLRGDRATLIVAELGEPRLLRPGEPIELRPDDAAVQLPLLIDQGTITAAASSRGSRLLRAGLCVLGSGRVLVALANNDSSDVLALALQKQGCRDAVQLDRGSHHAAFMHHQGTTEPPLSAYATSVLFGLSKP
jgi:hypothetical protein